MRQDILSATLDLTATSRFRVWWQLLIVNGSGSVVDISERILGGQWKPPNTENTIGTASITLSRDIDQDPLTSLAPSVSESLFNRLDDGLTYSELLKTGRQFKLSFSVVPLGTARPTNPVDYRTALEGRVDDVSWGQEYGDVEVTFYDNAGILQRTWTENGSLYPAGTPLETVLQGVIDDEFGTGAYEVVTPVASGYVTVEDFQPDGLVWPTLTELASKRGGWVLLPRYDITGALKFVFFEPARTKVVADYSHAAVYSVSTLEINDDNIRTVVEGYAYTDAGAEIHEKVENVAKTLEFGGIRRYMRLAEPLGSIINTPAKLLAYVNAGLSDTEDPDKTIQVRVPFFPSAEVAVDLYEFPPLNRLFDSAQYLAPFDVVHEIVVENKPSTTTIDARGKPSAGSAAWRDREMTTPLVSFLVEYASDDVGSNASSVFDPDLHFFMRQSSNGGTTWTAWFRIVGENGASADGRYTSFIFRVSTTQPATPTGDSPVGWSDDPPSYNPALGQILWMSVGEFDSVDDTLIGAWSVPAPLTGAEGPKGDPGTPGTDAPVLPAFGYVHQTPGDSLDTTDIAVQILDAEGRSGTLHIWTAKASYTDPIPTDPPDASVAVPTTPAVLNSASNTNLDNVHVHAGRGKKVYFQFIASDGATTGIVDKQLHSWLTIINGEGELIDEAMVSASQFARSIRPPVVVATLPTGNPDEYNIISVADQNGKLYRWDEIASGWVSVVRAADLDGQINTAQIADAAVIAGKLATNAVTSNAIANLAVTAGKVAASAISTANIVDSAIVAAKLATGAVTEAKIADLAVTSAKVMASAITTAKIADDAVAAAKIASLAVTSEKLGDLAVTEAKIAALAVTTAKLGNLSVSTAKIADAAIAEGKLATGAVTSDKLGALAVTAAKIAAGAVETAKIANLAVDAGKLAAGAVTETKIAALAVTTAKIADSAIATAKIADLAIAEGKLAANAVTAAKLADLAVTAAKIADSAITTTKLASEAVTAGNIAADAVFPSHLVGGWGGFAINDDPTMIDLNAWTLTGDWTIEPVVSGPAGTTAMRINETTGTSGRSIFSRKEFPVDVNRTYRISVWAVQTNGDGRNYFFVDFYNASGVQIGTSDQTGWLAYGTYFYWGVSNSVLPGGWNRYEITFGPDGEASIPPTAKTLRFGALVARSQTTPLTRVYLQDFRVEEVINTTLIANDAITTPKLITGAVVAAKIAAGAVEADKIAALAVTADKIAANAITAVKIDTGAITAGKIAAGAVLAASIASGAVTTDKLDANAVTAAKIAAGTITATEIASAAITSVKIAADAVTATHIAALTITAAEIATGAITTAKIAALAVTTSELAAGAVTAAKIQALTITAAQIAASTITGAKIAATTITAGNIASGAITTAKLDALAVTAEKIATGAITAAKIDALAVTAGKIAAGAVQAGNIAAGVITAVEIASGAITTDKLAANSITSDKLLVGTSANLVPNGDFETGDLSGWRPFSSPASMDVMASTTPGVPAGAPTEYILRFSTTSTTTVALFSHSQLYNSAPDGIRVVPGEQYYISTWYAEESGTVVTPRLIAYFYRVGGTTAGVNVINPFTETLVWQLFEGTVTVPADAVKMHLYLYAPSLNGTLYFAQVGVRKISPAVLIEDGAVTADKLQANAVTASKILAGAVTAAAIATGAVEAAKIAAGSVIAEKIASGAVTTAKLNALAVTADKIAAGAITADKILANAVTAVKIAAGSIDAAKIATGAVVATKIAAGAVTTDKLDALAVTSTKIDANAVTADKIAANAVTAVKILAGSIEAAKIATGAVEAIKIAAGAVTADKIAANSVTSEKLLVGTSANLLPNGDFATGTTEGWDPYDSPTSVSVVPSSDPSVPSGAPSRYVARFHRATAASVSMFSHAQHYSSDFTDYTSVEPGEQYRVRLMSTRTAGTSSTLLLYRYYKAIDGSLHSFPAATVTQTTGVWTEYAITFTVPVGVIGMRLRIRSSSLLGTMFFGQVSIQKVTPAVLIEDGAITADKLTTNSVVAGKIAAGAISSSALFVNGVIQAAALSTGAVIAEKIASNAVTAEKINVTSLSAISANVGTLTAGVIRNTANTHGLAIGNTQAPVSWTRYISFHDSDYFLKHEALTLDHSGNAVFSGEVAASSFTSQNAEFAPSGGGIGVEILYRYDYHEAGGDGHPAVIIRNRNGAGRTLVLGVGPSATSNTGEAFIRGRSRLLLETEEANSDIVVAPNTGDMMVLHGSNIAFRVSDPTLEPNQFSGVSVAFNTTGGLFIRRLIMGAPNSFATGYRAVFVEN